MQIHIVETTCVAPSEDLFKQRQQSIVLQALLEIDLVLLLLYPHFVQHRIVVRNSDLVEVSHHDEVLADVAAFEPTCKVVWHKPADHIAAGGDDAAKDVILDFEVT